MFAWWMSVAWAAPPPGVDLEALDAWESAARVLRDGPTGCWQFSGQGTVRAVLFRAPMLYGGARQQRSEYTGPFDGRFEQGVWRSLTYTLTPTAEDGLDLEPQLVPMVGRIDRDGLQRDAPAPTEEDEEGGSVSISLGGSGAQDGPRQAMSMVDRLLDAIDPSATTSYAQWGDAPRGVTLVQDIPLDDGPRAQRATLSTFFPSDAQLLDDAPMVATSLSMRFPKRMRVGEGLIKATLKDPQLHVRAKAVGDQPLPTVERVSMVVGALGFTVGYEQTLRYEQARPCEDGSTDTVD